MFISAVTNFNGLKMGVEPLYTKGVPYALRGWSVLVNPGLQARAEAEPHQQAGRHKPTRIVRLGSSRPVLCWGLNEYGSLKFQLPFGSLFLNVDAVLVTTPLAAFWKRKAFTPRLKAQETPTLLQLNIWFKYKHPFNN